MLKNLQLVVVLIERRHDIPNFIKQFQTELLHTPFDCKTSAGVANKGYENGLLLVTKAIDRIITAEDITQQDLVVSKLLRQDIEKYKSLFPHVSAAIQLSERVLMADILQRGILSTTYIQIHNTKIHSSGLQL